MNEISICERAATLAAAIDALKKAQERMENLNLPDESKAEALFRQPLYHIDVAAYQLGAVVTTLEVLAVDLNPKDVKFPGAPDE